MRTCEKCGCYIPKDWNVCPACSYKEQEIEKIYPSYNVIVKYTDDTVLKETLMTFMRREHAVSCARRYHNTPRVCRVEVWYCQEKILVYT